MTANNSNNTRRDLWLESQREAIQNLRPDHKVDVTDAVMEKISAMPMPLPIPVVSPWKKVMKWAAAACLAGVVVTVAMFSHNEAVAASTADLSSRVYEIYDYCNDYADPDMEEDSYYTENSVSEFL